MRLYDFMSQLRVDVVLDALVTGGALQLGAFEEDVGVVEGSRPAAVRRERGIQLAVGRKGRQAVVVLVGSAIDILRSEG